MKDLTFALLLSLVTNAYSFQARKSILVFSKTTRYYHESIPVGIAAIQKLGLVNNIKVDTTTDSRAFNLRNLRNYDAIVFLSTTGDILDSLQKESFKKYIRTGGGFVGIHSASASERDWEWYGKLVGAVFTDHPEPQTAQLLVLDNKHPATRHLPDRWYWHDEWYNFRNISEEVHMLLGVDEKTYAGGNHGNFHPLAWFQKFHGGRMFYTALGHFSAAYQDHLFLEHLLQGINYAIRRAPNKALKKIDIR